MPQRIHTLSFKIMRNFGVLSYQRVFPYNPESRGIFGGVIRCKVVLFRTEVVKMFKVVFVRTLSSAFVLII